MQVRIGAAGFGRKIESAYASKHVNNADLLSAETTILSVPVFVLMVSEEKYNGQRRARGIL